MTSYDVHSTIMQYIATTLEEYYSIPQRTMYHNAISLVTSQRISFKVSRQIRKRLYEKHSIDAEAKTNYDPMIIEKLDLSEVGIGQEIGKCVMEITAIALKKSESGSDIALADISSIKGIGPWTINAIKILHGLDNNIFLSEDSWIRERLSQVSGLPMKTKAQCDKFTQDWKDKTQISLFLWRLQKSGADKIHMGLQLNCKAIDQSLSDLTREDFV